jgi:membrane-associated phospholipid phosphatase
MSFEQVAVIMRVGRGATSKRSQAARRYIGAVRARDPRTVTISALAAAFLLEVVAFAHLVEDYLTGDPIVQWDVRFASWLHYHASHPLVRVCDVLTLAGNAGVLGVIVVAIGVLLLRRLQTNEAAVLGIAFAGSAIVNALLKLAFHRSRPELAFVHLDTYSFPSGHAAVSSATFAMLAYLLGRRYRSIRRRIFIAAGAAAAIAVVGFSRLYLGAHYLSDVLAGITFGLAWATLCLLAYTVWGERNLLTVLPTWAEEALAKFGQTGRSANDR